MKNALIIIVIIVILAVASAAGWFFLIKKSAEGGRCTNDARCETGLKCLNQKCSSGQKGSSCTQKSDCKSSFCVNKVCTEGKVGSACAQKTDCTSGFCVKSVCTEGEVGNTCVIQEDCNSSLLCVKKECTKKPDYSKYFSNVIISKIKPGMGPGPNNPETVTNTFTRADAIEIDFVGVKGTTVGDFYYEIVNSTTGEVLRSSKNEQQLTFSGQDRGTGTSLDNVAPGEYDLNIYFNNELVYTSQIIITQ